MISIVFSNYYFWSFFIDFYFSKKDLPSLDGNLAEFILDPIFKSFVDSSNSSHDDEYESDY